jgi:release factor glutamine methyltransferase|tara:strand:- start:1940 stop:2776 length:837 start_codon:yes stop_codon:yes gene_type:complete
MIVEEIVKQASNRLKKENINSHQLDSELILSHIMDVSREFLILNSQLKIKKNTLKKYNFAILRRIKREPIAYITGKKEFWSENFLVNENTLVPRPETELMIYRVLKFFKNRTINVLDIGTGSGCVLLSILKNLNFSRGTGIDISSKAIKVATTNAKNLNLSNRTHFKICDIKNYNIGKYDLIISNPPYIPSKDIKNLSKDIIDHEPKSALDGGTDGLDLIKKVIYKSNHLLKRNGLLVIEIGFNQYRKVTDILKRNKFREISKEFDYNSNVRCIISTK